VQFDEGLGDRQSKSGALMFAGQVICDLFERLEYLFDLFRGIPIPVSLI